MKYIDLPKYPTIGEIVFPDEPNTVYINRCALPICQQDRYYPLQIVCNLGHGKNQSRQWLNDPPLHRKSPELHLVSFQG